MWYVWSQPSDRGESAADSHACCAQNCKCPMSRKILLMRCTIAEMDLLIKNAKTRIMAALEDDDDEAAIIT
jgi:hypothetical protein